jgi:hypothetical protein
MKKSSQIQSSNHEIEFEIKWNKQLKLNYFAFFKPIFDQQLVFQLLWREEQ